MSRTYDRIYDVVRQIPSGQVATYGQVAELAGLIGKSRLVGYALYRVTIEADIPWHRVINAKGEVSHSPRRNGTDYLQRALLEDEGIVFTPAGKINLRQYRWQPPPDVLLAAMTLLQDAFNRASLDPKEPLD
ncbi:MGMT family protein [Leptolyngbya sp. PCC 6406]|uniref:MGMT family protein n=1 Tax=Leptolyngbya sp. PCC 6406 TaxID=1173264 RepID=UPI0002ABAAC7|nr:MGMT family protein [Leptolyngbya sp. PCC 6406]